MHSHKHIHTHKHTHTAKEFTPFTPGGGGAGGGFASEGGFDPQAASAMGQPAAMQMQQGAAMGGMGGYMDPVCDIFVYDYV